MRWGEGGQGLGLAGDLVQPRKSKGRCRDVSWPGQQDSSVLSCGVPSRGANYISVPGLTPRTEHRAGIAPLRWGMGLGLRPSLGSC